MTPEQFKQRVLDKYGPESEQKEHTEGFYAWFIYDNIQYAIDQIENHADDVWSNFNIIDLEAESDSSES